MSLIEVKKAFFDQKKLQNEANKRTLSALSKLGAFIRRTIQFSMKSKKGASPPGIPPYAHGQKLLRRHEYFYLDRGRKNLVVGPIRLSRTSSQRVPFTLEKGRVLQVHTRKGTQVRRYVARPYVRPAAIENLKKLKDLFRSK